MKLYHYQETLEGTNTIFQIITICDNFLIFSDIKNASTSYYVYPQFSVPFTNQETYFQQQKQTTGNQFYFQTLKTSIHIYCFYSCRLPDEYANASFHLPPDVLNASFPWDDTRHVYSNCSILVNGEARKCNEYIYDHSKYESSAYFEVFVGVFLNFFE